MERLQARTSRRIVTVTECGERELEPGGGKTLLELRMLAVRDCQCSSLLAFVGS